MNREQKVIFITGIILFILAWVMEINFHFIQGITLEFIEDEALFWKLENSIYPVSTFLLVFGIILIIIAIVLSRQSRSKPKSKRSKRSRR